MFSYMTHNHSTISIHNHSTLLGLGLENDGKQMTSNCLQGKLDRLWMIRGGSSLVMRGGSTLGRIDRFPIESVLLERVFHLFVECCELSQKYTSY